MNAVGIDVSKRKSTVTIRRPGDQVILKPCDFRHTQSGINALIQIIRDLDGETKVCMEHTGRYYEPVARWLSDAGIFVSAVNPILVKQFGNDSLHAPKTDKADAKKIARFALDRWPNLKQYGPMDEIRTQLKTMNRQFGGSQKWVDFVRTYWHVDCVRGRSLKAFTEHYQNWCRRRGYNFSAAKAEQIYRASADLIAVFPKDVRTKRLIQQAVDMLNTISGTVETLRAEMDETASRLPEYPVVMAMNGVGPTLGPQLMAEIGDITRYEKRGSLTAFAGVDPGKNESGDYAQKSVHTSKKGSPHLRKTLFQIMESLIQRAPADDPVYAFMDKKRAQGKQYYVYMTAGANKFLRIYYGRVKEYIAGLSESD